MVATNQTAGLGTKYGFLFSDTTRPEKRHRYSVLLSTLARKPGINYREAYVYDGQNVALLFRGTGTGNLGSWSLNHGFLYGPAVDQVLADQTTVYGGGWNVRWPLADNLGTIRDVVKFTPGSGGGDTTTIVDHLRYDAFGKITTQTNPVEQPRFTYTARELDADTGLYYYRARWYDAATGKFMSEDPIDFRGGDENLYRYVRNRATDLSDPSGCTIKICSAAYDKFVGWLKDHGAKYDFRHREPSTDGYDFFVPKYVKEPLWWSRKDTPDMEIATEMIINDGVFSIKGDTEAEAMKNWKGHVFARTSTIRNALKFNAAFGNQRTGSPVGAMVADDGRWTRWDGTEFARGQAATTVDTVLSLRGTNISLFCSAATAFMLYGGFLDAARQDLGTLGANNDFQTHFKGDNLITGGRELIAQYKVPKDPELAREKHPIPGDWFIIASQAVTRPKPNAPPIPVQEGNEGQNLIYVGAGDYVGHHPFIKIAERHDLRFWKGEVAKLNGGAGADVAWGRNYAAYGIKDPEAWVVLTLPSR